MQLIPFITTLAAAVFGFWLNETWRQAKERKERYKQVLALLSAAEMELDFYVGKLDIFTQMLGDLERSKFQPLILPSFDFYPAFLEELKSQLVAYKETADMASVIGECHFELCHIQVRLVGLRDSVGKASELVFAGNAGGLKDLAESNVKRFGDARTRVQTRKSHVSADLTRFCDESVFASFMND